MSDKHECIFCGEFKRLRVLSDGRPYGAGLDLICEDCFTGTDDGPSFDDLPEAHPARALKGKNNG